MRQALVQYRVWFYLIAILAGMAIGWGLPEQYHRASLLNAADAPSIQALSCNMNSPWVEQFLQISS